MKKGKRCHDEEAGLAKSEGKPQSNSRERAGGDIVKGWAAEVFSYSLPYKDCEGQNIARSEPNVALVCRRKHLEVRKTKLGLLGHVYEYAGDQGERRRTGGTRRLKG